MKHAFRIVLLTALAVSMRTLGSPVDQFMAGGENWVKKRGGPSMMADDFLKDF